MTGKCKPQEFSWAILSLSFSTWKGSFQHSPMDRYWITLWGRSIFLSRPLMAQMVKNLPAIQESRVPSLCQENPLEKGMATHSSILAWRIPWTEEPGQLQSMGSQRVTHDWATNTENISRGSAVPLGALWEIPWKSTPGTECYKCHLCGAHLSILEPPPTPSSGDC